MFPYMTHIIIIFRPFTFPWPIVCILCVRLNEGVCCYTQDDPISNYRGCKYFCQWFRLELWQTVKHVHIVSYLDLDLKRSRQTPDMGYHVDERRRRTSADDSWSSWCISLRRFLCQVRSTGELFGGRKIPCMRLWTPRCTWTCTGGCICCVDPLG